MREKNTDIQALEAFILDNPELAELEALIAEFNLFEAIGAVRPELRHSDFLAFLLNPQQNHGLGDTFVRQLLQRALTRAETPSLPITPLQLALLDLDNLEVRREWRNIDILLMNTAGRLVVIIENKIDSGEHREQLSRYWRIAGSLVPDAAVIGLFLTPEGYEASDPRYIAIDYSLIHEILVELSNNLQPSLPGDVHVTLRHYVQMLRRHIMPDSDVAALCRQIYRRHQRALDLIFEFRPDVQAEVRDLLEELIAGTPGLEQDQGSKTSIRFIPRAWDSPILKSGSGWVESGRMLLFEIDNGPERLSLKLYIGPGPEEIRDRLHQMTENTPLLQIQRRGTKWTTIFLRRILNKRDYQDATVSDLAASIRKGWQQFLDHDLPRLTEVIREQEWLWTEGNVDNPNTHL